LSHLSGGGAERQFEYLASELLGMGHGVDVAYLRDGPARPNLNGIVTHQLRAKNNHNPSLLWQLVQLSRQIEPDVIHTWLLQMDILGGLAARLSGIPWVMAEQSSATPFLPRWKDRLRVRIAASASAIISNSLGGDEYWKNSLPNDRRFVIQNGLALNEIEGAVAVLPSQLSNTRKPIVLYVGRISFDRSGNKNLKAFLEVLKCVSEEKQVLGVLCGEGQQRSELELLRDRLGLREQIHFTGHLPSISVWGLMKRASLFVSLSAYEGCPNSVMEAVACGCPLILSDIPAHRELLDESCAVFVDSADVQQVAGAIVQALSNAGAATRRALIAKQRIHEWSIAEKARDYENVYQLVTAASSNQMRNKKV